MNLNMNDNKDNNKGIQKGGGAGNKEEEFIGIVPASSIKYVNEFESRVSLSLLNKSFRCIIEI